MKQTYDNYFKDYFTTPSGRAAKAAAQRKYRQKLAKKYGVGQAKAARLRKQEKA